MVTESTISGNKAARYGGGISTSSPYPSLTVTGSTISGNSAGSEGGGIKTPGFSNELNQTIVGGTRAALPPRPTTFLAG